MTTNTLDGSITPAVVLPDTTTLVTDGNTLSLLGTILNLGTIFADGTGTPIYGPGSPASTLVASIVISSPTVTLTGGGTVVLAQSDYSDIYAGDTTLPILVNLDNTIEGAGELGVPAGTTFSDGGTAYPIGVVNEAAGIIDANNADFYLDVVAGTLALTNAGLLEATAAGGLFVDGPIVNTGGTILATGTGDNVLLNDTSLIQGGLIEALEGGVVYFNGIPTTLQGVTLESSGGGVLELQFFPTLTLDGTAAPDDIVAGTTLELIAGGTILVTGTIADFGTISFLTTDGNGAALDLSGTIHNLGTIQQIGLPDISLATPSVTLDGGGTLLLTKTSAENNSILPSGSTAAGIVNIDNTISGAGTIGQIPSNSYPAIPVALINEAAGVVNASDPTYALAVFAGTLALSNAGLMEATASGGLLLDATTLDNTGGTVLATGTGDVVTLIGIDVLGGTLEAVTGGTILFTGSSTLDVAANAAATTVSLAADATLAVSGTLSITGTLTLDTGAAVVLSGGELTGASGSSVVNVDDLISGGTLGNGTAALSLTNEAAGVLTNVDIDLPGGLRNAGLVEVTPGNTLDIGTTGASTIDNRGGTLLAAGGLVAVDDADIVGGTLAASAGGVFLFGSLRTTNSVTLDGSSAPLTIAAGTTIQTYYTEQSPPYVFDVGTPITLVGTIDNFGTLLGAGLYSGAPPVNDGVLTGAGTVVGSITNNGTLLAAGGTMTVGSVGGTGSIAIASGATFDLGAGAAQAIDFRDAVGSLLFSQPVYYSNDGEQEFAYYTGALTNLVVGDSISLPGENIATAEVISSDTLAVTMVNGTTLDYSLVNFAAGATVDVVSATAERTEFYNLSYTGTPPGSGAAESISGTFAVTTGSGTVGLSAVTEFRLLLTGGSNDGVITYDLATLQSFSATFGADDALTSLSFATSAGSNSSGQGTTETFTVSSLATGGAATSNTTGTAVASDGGQQFAELLIACYASGTRIATARGEMPVEALRIGDHVVSTFGGAAAIAWIGHRRIDCRRHRRPHAVWPVRVRTGAFGASLPTRDLLLSPDHAVFVDDVLIPIRHLVNGATIVQEEHDEVTYWHVELGQHDVMLAEGLPCESYLDTGNRSAFANGGAAAQVHPNFASDEDDNRHELACAPLVTAGPILATLRGRLAARATTIGLPPPRGLEILLNAAGTTRASVPAGVETIRLISQSEQKAGDRRRLGALVAGLRIDGVVLPLDDIRLGFGFYGTELHGAIAVRWTDGAANIAIGGGAERVIEIEAAAVAGRPGRRQAA